MLKTMNNIRLFSIIGVLKGAYFYIPIFSLYLLSAGVPLSAIVIGNIFWSLGAFIGEVPTGIFADTYGQKAAIVLGYLLEALGMLIVFFHPSIPGLYVYYAVSGFAYSFLSGSEEALLYESVRHEKRTDFQKVYGRFLSNEQLGFVSSSALAGILYHFFGATVFVPLLLATSLSFFVATTLACLLENHRAKIHNPSEGAGMWAVLRESASLIRRNEIILTLTIVSVLTVSGQYLLQAVYQPHFEAHGVPALWIGLVVAFGTLLNALATRYIYILEKHLSLEKILLLINGTQGVLFVLLAWLVHPAILVLLYIGAAGLFNLQVPIVSDYINPRTSSHIRTTVLSGMSFIKRFFELFLGIALGKIVGLWGIEASLLTQGMYLLLGIGISYYLLVRCGCAHKVENPDGEQLEFSTQKP